MKEDFLYYVWQYKLFSKTALKTSKQDSLVIKDVGKRNVNSGPDFLNAQLFLDNQHWAGNVEIHIKSSDWYLHKHETDVNYDAVILHVVWEHDTDVFMKNNKPLPTLELKDIVDKKVFKAYQEISKNYKNWIPCENQISGLDDFLILNWLERLYFERLESKSEFITELLKKNNFDFEAVLFLLLAKNFGLKINGDAFLQLANSIDFSIIRKVRFDKKQLNALLFGQAGFLIESIEEPYYNELQKEYEYLSYKYKLKPISKHVFQFFRMRPHNFPTIRIAQLSALYYKHQNLFSSIMEINIKDHFYDLFKIKINDFWKNHFTFDKASKSSSKNISKAFVDLVLINTIIPLKFVYLKYKGENFNEEILKLIQQVSSEKNSIITKFKDLKLEANNAMESQALLELKNNYCTKKRCLQCAIGNYLVRK